MPAKWTLLCGGDCYLPGSARNTGAKGVARKYRNLKGAVRDVNLVNAFLVAADHSINIAQLTATCKQGQDEPAEERHSWPTFENIERELNRITQKACTGDLVYIHYSGHGICREDLAKATSFGEDDDTDPLKGMALVMTDVLAGGAYLAGSQLAAFLQKMVQKGLRVTLVLDSCYSGRGLRNPLINPNTATATDVADRTMPGQYDDTWLQSDDAAEGIANSVRKEIISSQDGGMGHRSATSIRSNWLSRPTGCVVFTACGPGEIAKEGAFGPISPSPCGAFTYAMVQVLQSIMATTATPSTSTGVRLPSHHRLLSHIKDQLRKIKASQVPCVLGDGNFEFFGSSYYAERPACRVTFEPNSPGQIRLDVGSAQGAAVGALYGVFQRQLMDWDPEQGVNNPRLEARVTKVSTFCSSATLAEPLGVIGNEDPDKDSGPWFAVLRRWALPDPVTIKFHSPRTELLPQLQAALEKHPQLVLLSGEAVSPSTSPTFTIKISKRHGIFQVFDNTGSRLARLPRISLYNDDDTAKERHDASHAFSKLAYTLSHVARYQALQKLLIDTPASTTPHHPNLNDPILLSPSLMSLRIENITGSSQQASNDREPLPESHVTCKDGDELEMFISYTGNQLPVIYASAFCFDASWGIHRLEPHPEDAPGQTWIACLPQREYEGPQVTMSIRGGDEFSFSDEETENTTGKAETVIDTFLLLASSAHDLSWDEICLESLPADGSDGGGLEKLMKADIIGRTSREVRDDADNEDDSGDEKKNPKGRDAKLLNGYLGKGPRANQGTPVWTAVQRVVHTTQ